MTTAKIEFDNQGGIVSRLMSRLRSGVLWLGAFAFAIAAAMATFFFALAAVAGIAILIGALTLVWLMFRIAGSRRRPEGDGNTLNARRGPHGWTVDGVGPFGPR